jgi:hypothetical protein
MRFFLVAVLALLNLCKGFSQTESNLFYMEWGKEYKKSEFRHYKGVGETKGEYIFLKKKGNVHFFEKMTPDGTKLKSELITCRKFRRFYKKIEWAYVADKYILLHSYVHVSSRNRLYTIVDLFDAKSMLFIKNVSLDSVSSGQNNVDRHYTENPQALMNKVAAHAYTDESGEKKFVVVVYQIRLKEFTPGRRLNTIRYNPIIVRHYDSKWNLVNQVDLRKILDYKLSDEVTNCGVDSSGNAWCVYNKYLEDKVPRWPSIKPYQMGLVSIKEEGKLVDNTLLDFNSDLLTQSVEMLTKGNKFLICGYYSEKNFQYTEGCFSISIDLDSPQNAVQTRYPFTEEFIESGRREKEILNSQEHYSDKGIAGMEDMRLETVYDLKDGGCIVTGRQLPNLYANQCEFIESRFNSSGELLWTKKLPVTISAQKSQGDYAGVFNQCGESLVLMYNSYPSREGNAFVGYVIHPDGSSQSEIIQWSKNNEISIPLYWSAWLSDCSRGFIVRKKKTVQFVVLKMH